MSSTWQLRAPLWRATSLRLMPSPVSTYGQVVPGKPMTAGQMIITFPIGVRATCLGGRGDRSSPTSSALVTSQSRSRWQPVSVCWRSYASLRLTLWSSCLVTIPRSVSSLENRPKIAKWTAKENSRHQVYAVSPLEFGWRPGWESNRDDRFRSRLEFVYTVHCFLLSLFSPAFVSSACLRLVFAVHHAALRFTVGFAVRRWRRPPPNCVWTPMIERLHACEELTHSALDPL